MKTLRLPTTVLNFQGETLFFVSAGNRCQGNRNAWLLIKNVRQSRGSWRRWSSLRWAAPPPPLCTKTRLPDNPSVATWIPVRFTAICDAPLLCKRLYPSKKGCSRRKANSINNDSHYLTKIDLGRSPARQRQFHRETAHKYQWATRSVKISAAEPVKLKIYGLPFFVCHFSFPFLRLHSFRGGLSYLHTQASSLYVTYFI